MYNTTAGTDAAVVQFEDATAIGFDGVSSINSECTPLSGTDFPIGQTTVECWATEGERTGRCYFTVIVVGKFYTGQILQITGSAIQATTSYRKVINMSMSRRQTGNKKNAFC